jgi:hypothetical protein
MPKRPQVECCVPQRRPFASGWAWAHAVSCRVNPRGRISISQVSSLETMRRVGLQNAETTRAGVVTVPADVWTLVGETWTQADRPHTPDERMRIWTSHPIDCDCAEACRYVNAHADDNTD